jgi:hypothetical protein
VSGALKQGIPGGEAEHSPAEVCHFDTGNVPLAIFWLEHKENDPLGSLAIVVRSHGVMHGRSMTLRPGLSPGLPFAAAWQPSVLARRSCCRFDKPLQVHDFASQTFAWFAFVG